MNFRYSATPVRLPACHLQHFDERESNKRNTNNNKLDSHACNRLICIDLMHTPHRVPCNLQPAPPFRQPVARPCPPLPVQLHCLSLIKKMLRASATFHVVVVVVVAKKLPTKATLAGGATRNSLCKSRGPEKAFWHASCRVATCLLCLLSATSV